MKKIVLIDDDPVLVPLLCNLLSKSGYDVTTAETGEEGLRAIRIKDPDIVITDFEMPGMTGLDVVLNLVKSHPGLPVIMLTCHSDVSITIKAVQAGAYDYLEKPIQPKRLLDAVRNGILLSMQSRQITEPVSVPVRKIIEDNLLSGTTPQIRDIVKHVGRISMSRMNVLITGEPGTGKAQVANLIHYSGITRDFPLIFLNCDSMDDQSLEHEILGYAKNAFEYARRPKEGKLVQAGEGTIVLNEFQRLPMPLQMKLSRILEDQIIFIPGEEEPQRFKARMIATSSDNLDLCLLEGRLHKELYYILKVFHIDLPALRHRLADIPELVEFFMDKQRRRLSKQVNSIEDGLLDLLKHYQWPGNIRELENAILQAMILARGDMLEKEHIQMFIREEIVETPVKNHLSLADLEKIHIQQILDDVNWRKQEAVKILDITRPTLNAKIDKYGLTPRP